MARGLTVAFAPPHEATPELSAFAKRLRGALTRAGATVLDERDARGPDGTIREGVVVVEQGEGPTDALAVRRVRSLYRNPLVALYDAPPPVAARASLQETLDGIVGVLAWNLTHIPVFIHGGEWTVCTMNGAVIPCGSARDVDRAVRETLVPKLAAQVVPPDPAALTVREGALDLGPLAETVGTFCEGAAAWDASGLLLAHTSLDRLRYRDRWARRIVSAYLDKRTGMSYGFLAHQLPVAVTPAARVASGGGSRGAVRVECAGETWWVRVPDVSVLCTRSGCDKTRIMPRQDLVRLTLSRGGITMDTPPEAGGDCRPSYDTLAILAHAAGNAIAASLLLARDAADPFARALAARGLALAHWHGYPAPGAAPEAFAVHGASNPPVSCSTPQSAVYALTGKLEALGARLGAGAPYRGDVHVEPHHGSNLTGAVSLAEAARWAETQASVAA